MGTLELWDFYLDVNMVVLLIISIGLAVDFSAHVGYTFLTITGKKNGETTEALLPYLSGRGLLKYDIFYLYVCS